jgi:hypothetical protein
MRPASRALTGLAALGLSWAGFAAPLSWGQNAPTLTTPLPPLQQQWQEDGSPPVQEAPTGDNAVVAPGPGAQGPNQALPAAPPMVPPRAPVAIERPNVWVPGGVAKLQALDKVNAQTANLTIKVGQSATFGSLTITVKSCVVRPSDQPADAAAFLNVTDSHPDSPGFDGWMLADEPSVSMMQHPIYDLRVTGCA